MLTVLSILLLSLTSIFIVQGQDATRFPTCTGVPTQHPSEAPATLWPTGAPHTLWPTGAPHTAEPTPVTAWPTSTNWPSYTPQPSTAFPTREPSSAQPTPSYALVEPTLLPTANPSVGNDIPTNTPTAAPSGVFWYLGFTQFSCDKNCYIATGGTETNYINFPATRSDYGQCVGSYLSLVTTREMFNYIFRYAKFAATCKYIGATVLTATQSAGTESNVTSYCKDGLNFESDFWTGPGAYTYNTFVPGATSSVSVEVSITRCGYPTKLSDQNLTCSNYIQDPANQRFVQSLCPCDRACTV
jgi:hypothetical protein